MSDRGVVVTAAAVYAIVLWSPGVPRSLGVVALGAGAAALALRRPRLAAAAVIALAAVLAQRAEGAISRPVRERAVHEWVTVIRDPEPIGAGVHLDVRIGTLRFETSAYGADARVLAPRLVGEQLLVRGHIRPLERRDRFTDQRHVVGRFSIDEVIAWRRAEGAYALANWLRRTLATGAASLPREHRPLFTGLVYGDDREQQPAIADDFRGAGLGHLLAVSGQNVAFVVAVFAPLTERFTQRVRFPLLIGILCVFGVVTRFEPSVLRASFMFAVGATATALGRASTGRRNLALTVIALLLVDPLIARSIGFVLSVLATVGIIELAPAIAAKLPLPRPVALALSVTLAAQVGVAPMQLAQFGGLPVAAIPANLVAAPLAGPVMMWGLAGGFVAGLAPPPLAALIHAPTRVLVAAIAHTARVATGARLGELQTAHVLAIAIAIALLSLLKGRAAMRSVATVAVIAVMLTPAVELRSSAPRRVSTEAGIEILRDREVAIVALDTGASASRALRAMRRAGVAEIDLLVLADGSRRSAAVVAAVRDRHRVRRIWAPERHAVRGATTPPTGQMHAVGSFTVSIASAAPRLEAHFARVASPP